MFSKFFPIFAGIAVALMIAFLVSCLSDRTPPSKPAPMFTAKTLDGKSFDLKDEAGHVVVLDFWATWCGPCVQSLPNLQKLHDDADLKAKGLHIYAINNGEEPDAVRTFVEKQHLTVPILLDESMEIGQKFSFEYIPATVIIGRDGKVRQVFEGYYDDSDAKIRAALKEALEEH